MMWILIVVVVEEETVEEEEIIIIFVVVILIIQISKESHGTMIVKEKLHKNQKVMKKYVTDMEWLDIGTCLSYITGQPHTQYLQIKNMFANWEQK